MKVETTKKDILYDKKLAAEWADWVETPNPNGSREKELFPELVAWLNRTGATDVLDIGCGQGILSCLVPPGVRYSGVDISPHLIARATQLYSAARNTFKIGDAYKLPFGDGMFDAAISFWVWSHLDNPVKAAGEMCRILKSGGHYLVITANPATYDVRKSFYSKYEEKDGKLIGDFDLGNGKQLTNTTLYLHKEQGFRDALELAHLSVEDVKYLGMSDDYPGGLYVRFSGTKK